MKREKRIVSALLFPVDMRCLWKIREASGMANASRAIEVVLEQVDDATLALILDQNRPQTGSGRPMRPSFSLCVHQVTRLDRACNAASVSRCQALRLILRHSAGC